MIKVLTSGFYTTIQDLGRLDFQEYGVPMSGTMDSTSALLANTLLRNDETNAVMEITMTGPKLEFTTNTQICICGANMSPKLNNTVISNNTVINIKSGDILSFGKLEYGFRCYLAVSGGFQTEYTMNSYSMYSGITSNTILSKGDEIAIKNTSDFIPSAHSTVKIDEQLFNSNKINVFKGPEFDQLTIAQQKQIENTLFSISKNNNRMAYQLNEVVPNTLKPIITSAVMPGTVQLTPSGTLIILMKDCQTTGGYPRVLQLEEQSISVLSQKMTSNDIQFKLI